MDSATTDPTVELLATLTARGLTVAIAESLTGGLLSAELTRPPGASAVVVGAVIAYATEIKHSVLGVSTETLALHGPVHADVAMQLALGVREALQIDGVRADIGISTTGVAGPDSQSGQLPGTVFVGVSYNGDTRAFALDLQGSRDQIRAETVRLAVQQLGALVASPPTE